MFYSTDLGLLILRLSVGLNMALLSGWGKVSAGPAMWRQVGSVMPSFGLDFMPLAWGLLAAFAEFGCSILLSLGVFFRLAVGMLAFTMAVAVWVHLHMPAESGMGGWKGAGHALVFLGVYAGLFVSGPGKHVLVLKKK
jgi:putative oxidoreductase